MGVVNAKTDCVPHIISLLLRSVSAALSFAVYSRLNQLVWHSWRCLCAHCASWRTSHSFYAVYAKVKDLSRIFTGQRFPLCGWKWSLINLCSVGRWSSRFLHFIVVAVWDSETCLDARLCASRTLRPVFKKLSVEQKKVYMLYWAFILCNVHGT